MLSVKHVFSGYNNQYIIKDMSFNVDPGCNLCIIGPKGCGKTTLLKTLAHLIPYKGNIKINNYEISKLSRKELAKNVGMMTQIHSIYFPYTVYETVSLGRYAHIDSILTQLSSIDKDIINHSLEKVGLIDKRNVKINKLSGGQLQRVFLAKIFAQNPKIILLDEPPNNLDLKYQIELLEYVKEWANENKRAVVSVLHDLNLVQIYGDKVILLNHGEKYSHGSPREVLVNNRLEEVYKNNVKEWMANALVKWVG